MWTLHKREKEKEKEKENKKVLPSLISGNRMEIFNKKYPQENCRKI